MNDFEHDLRRGLDELAGGVEPSADLEKAVNRRVRARQRRPLAVATGGVAAAIVLVAAVLVPRLGGPDSAVVATGPDGQATSTTAPTTATTATSATTATTSVGGSPSTTTAVPTTATTTTAAGPTTTAATTTPPAPGTAAFPLCPGRAPARSTVLPARLPRELYRAGAVWDRQFVYLLGGMHSASGGVGYSDEIVRFEPATGQVTTLPTRLPAGIGGAATVWDGTAAYLFGGYHSQNGYWNGIVRFDPSTGLSGTLRPTLPFGLDGATAVWDGRNAYIVGGTRYANGNYDGEFDRVIRFTPSTGEVTLVDARVAGSGAAVKAAAWDGRRIVVVAGPREIYFYTPVPDAKVVAFDPASGAVSPLPGAHPVVIGTRAEWACGQLLLFGGTHETGDEVVSYDPASGRFRTVGSLPQPIGNTQVVWDGAAALVLGGLVHTGPATAGSTSEIVRFE